MVKIREAIVVEGRYDKNTLSQVVDAPILETAGFGIFKDRQQMALLRRVAEKRGLIVFTDSDGAGFVIRNYLKGALPKDQVKQAYIPDRPGKEKRKKAPSKAGFLGVEGLSAETLRRLLERSGVVCETESGESVGAEMRRTYTKADLYAVGLCGREDSHAYRDAFCTANDLPIGMTAGALLEAINLFGIALPDGE